jgi:dTDP-4-amino-4,6-dideoxygalactose transaminase
MQAEPELLNYSSEWSRFMSGSQPHIQNVEPCAPIPFIDLVAQYHTIRNEVREAVDRCFETQSFILGEQVTLLEHEIASYCDSQFAIGCASGTDALILALLAAGVKPGDEVITSPFTFFASAGAIHRVGATPVLVDIEPDSFNICPQQVERAITSKTSAIMPVHIFGQCAEMEPLWRFSAAHGIPIIEDAAQAIGAEYKGRRAGVLGSIGCFSFFPTKNLGGAGDGGIMTTDNPEVAERLKRLRVHGDTGGYNHVEVGFNSRLDALQAAVLRVKLRHLDAWTAGRTRNAARYQELISANGLTDAITLPAILPNRRHVFNQFTTRITNGRREEVIRSMKEQQIGCAVYYPVPLHMQKCFAYLGYQMGDLPEAERASAEVLSLPIYTELPEAHLDRIVEGLCTALGRQSTLTFPTATPVPQRRAA